MEIETMTVFPGQKPTEEQKKQIAEASHQPIEFDADCPELTPEQLEKFALLAEKQRAERKKPVLSLRISPETMAKAKKLGRGYTGILSRLLDLAINNPDMLKKCL